LNIAAALRSGFPPAREWRIHPHGNLHHVIPTNLHPVIPTRTENQNQKPKIPSFPRKWESRNEKQQAFIENNWNRTD